jgi:hypothetical protein
LKTAAIVGWTGNGSLDDLSRTALGKLPSDGAEVTSAARSLTVRGEDPIAVARKLAHLPGVRWIAAGYQFKGLDECLSRLRLLATRYLGGDSSFAVGVEVEGSGKEEGDVLMEATSTLLRSARGSRVDEKNPDVMFRVIMVRGSGACGVQLREGAGGVPTSREMKASCLVSGGYHSAVAAWMAANSGFSLTLVHARDDDGSLRQVARLYAELSQRIDPSSLRLEVLQGRDTAGDRVAAWLRSAEGEVFAGVHPECRGTAGMDMLRRYPSVLFPLLFLQEGEIRSRLDSLGLKGTTTDREAGLKLSNRRARFTVKTFGGREADQNAVLDSILA